MSRVSLQLHHHVLLRLWSRAPAGELVHAGVHASRPAEECMVLFDSVGRAGVSTTLAGPGGASPSEQNWERVCEMHLQPFALQVCLGARNCNGAGRLQDGPRLIEHVLPKKAARPGCAQQPPQPAAPSTVRQAQPSLRACKQWAAAGGIESWPCMGCLARLEMRQVWHLDGRADGAVVHQHDAVQQAPAQPEGLRAHLAAPHSTPSSFSSPHLATKSAMQV